MIDRRLYLKSIQAVFNKNQQFKEITRQTHILGAAKELLESSLPKSLAQQATTYSYKGGRLVITVPNSTLLTQLRFHIPNLLQVFKTNETFHALKKIHLKIEKPNYSRSTLKKRVVPISEHNANLIQETAKEIEHPPLKKAMLKLAQNAKGGTNR